MDLDAATANMIKNLEEKYGKPLQTWVNLVQKSGIEKYKQRVDWLKAEHGMTHGYANLIAHFAKQEPQPPADDPLALMFQGKENLRPIYDALLEKLQGFGNDLEIAPKKANVSIRRSKQFALLQPSTKSRFDVGIQLKGETPEGRLEASGSWNAMVSHRVRLESPVDVDDQLIAWLKTAYDRA
ncbi:MAG: DUF4287 domain-containing protein [Acidobacteria bacterium]|nr:DUF4287 domain-containing protein [Acidobacteriota bacterium]MCB9398508.1 DUF4287 domain-containing protein [Acidobacteriota bacterium]